MTAFLQVVDDTNELEKAWVEWWAALVNWVEGGRTTELTGALEEAKRQWIRTWHDSQDGD